MGLYAAGSLEHLIAVNSWKGNTKMKPCFCAVYDGRVKMTDNETYQALADARSDRDKEKVEAIVRDSISVINAAIGNNVIEAEVQVATTTPDF